MRSTRDYLVYLEDMLHAAEQACAFTQDMGPEDFFRCEEKIFAVTRALEIIGKAAKHVPPSIRNDYPDIPWRIIAGTRDKLIHAYFDVHVGQLWTTVQEDLPPLRTALIRVISDIKSRE